MQDIEAPHLEPHIIPRNEHSISRKDISENALKVLYRLNKAGYEAYLVGGGVRDLLLDKHPKDFDVATDATPEQVKDLFRNCRLIGRRFRLAHIHFGRDIIEVATFRGHHSESESAEGHVRDGMIVRDNVFGSLEEDAWRRDFTVNALYYNINDFTLVDFTGGLKDLKDAKIRAIGDPNIRCQEDPVRMLRAIRFAAKLEFTLGERLEDAIARQAQRLEAVPSARLFDEVLKLFQTGHAHRTFELLKQYDLLRMLFKDADELIKSGDDYTDTIISQGLANTDQRIAMSKPVTPAFLFAVMLWGLVLRRAQVYEDEGMTRVQSLQEAGRDILVEASQQVSIPKRFRLMIREIWTAQARLMNRRGRRAMWLLSQPRFRAAYDFLLLRAQAGETELSELADWWTRFQQVDEKERAQMCKALSGKHPRRRKRRH